jgi:hypothetical protein
MSEPHRPREAATDVAEFLTDLDGGQFETMLSVAVSQVAAAAIDHERKGKVKIELDFEKIKNTHQVVVTHTLKFEKPSRLGSTSETVKGGSVLHVGKGGRLTLAQQRLIDENSQDRIPGA